MRNLAALLGALWGWLMLIGGTVACLGLIIATVVGTLTA